MPMAVAGRIGIDHFMGGDFFELDRVEFRGVKMRERGEDGQEERQEERLKLEL